MLLGGGLLSAESNPQTTQLKSSLGKLLMAHSSGIQGAHWRSPAQPHMSDLWCLGKAAGREQYSLGCSTGWQEDWE